MKKITKTNLQSLRELFPVLSKEEMCSYVGGGFSGSYYDWLNHGFGCYDSNGNYYWHSGYTKDEYENWEGPWYGGWVYGLGYVAPDTDIYGYKPGGGSSNPHEYPYYEPWEHPDWDGNYGGYYYGSFDDGNPNLIHLNDGECVVAAIVNAGIMLGVDLSVSSITSVTGVVGHLTENELRTTVVAQYYILDHK